MSRTLLQIVNDAEDELGLARSTTVAGSTANQARQLLSVANRVGLLMRQDYEWVQLSREYTFTLYEVGPYTGDTTAGAFTITNLSSTTGIEPGFAVTGSGFGTSTVANNVRVVSVDSATQVTVNIAASTTTTTADYYFAQESYAMPGDFDYHLNRTHWDRTNRWELMGPISPQEWQWRKSGIIASTPRRRFRIKGAADTQFFVDPAPGSGDSGQYLSFEYQSSNWVRPKTWTASTSFAAGTYSSYNGNYYYTAAGGTTGSTAPVHKSGSVSDGGVTWLAYVDSPYDRFLADTDIPVLDEDLISMGIIWFWRKRKSLAYADDKEAWEAQVSSRVKKMPAARTLNAQVNNRPRMLISVANVPETGFGQTT